MNFELNEQQKLIQQAARDFARSEILPIAAQCDREANFPLELMDKARDVGLVNVTVPAEYGGSGLGAFDLALVTQELAWACTGINGALGLNSVIADVFHVAGSVEQKKQVFSRLNSGEFGGYALTEPDAGSDCQRSRRVPCAVVIPMCSTATRYGYRIRLWRNSSSYLPEQTRMADIAA